MDYENYSPGWQQQVRALADDVLGTGYFVGTLAIAGEPETHAILCIEDRQLLGFAHARLLPKFGLGDFLERRIEIVPEDLKEADAAGTLGVIQMIVVAPERRGNGIGTGLIASLHDRLVGHGADKLIATFKRGPGSSRIEEIMRRMGFVYWVELDSYWREHCDRGSFICADRTDRCICQALFFRKIVY